MESIVHRPPGAVKRGQERPMNEAQKRKLLGEARRHGLTDPVRQLPALVAEVLPGVALEALGGDRELDAVLAALPGFADRQRSATAALTPAELFAPLAGRRSFDGSWSNAAGSFRVRAANALADGELADFLAWSCRCTDLPTDFRAELRRQVGPTAAALA